MSKGYRKHKFVLPLRPMQWMQLPPGYRMAYSPYAQGLAVSDYIAVARQYKYPDTHPDYVMSEVRWPNYLRKDNVTTQEYYDETNEAAMDDRGEPREGGSGGGGGKWEPRRVTTGNLSGIGGTMNRHFHVLLQTLDN